MSTRPLVRPRANRTGRAKRAAIVAPAALVMLLASGCGSDAGSQGSPADAAVINGESVSRSSTDNFADDYCELYRPRLMDSDQRVAMGYMRAAVLDLLVRDKLVRELADERGVELPAEYRSVVGDLRAQAKQAGVPNGKATETWLRIQKLDTYANTVFLLLAMETEGTTELPQDEATYNRLLQAGQQEYAAWVEEQDIERNPAYGEGGTTAEEPYIGPVGFSVAVSSEAKFADKPPELGSAAYLDAARDLPENQVCG